MIALKRISMIVFLLFSSRYTLADSNSPNFDSREGILLMPLISVDNEAWYGNVKLQLDFITGQFSVIAATPADDPNSIPQTNNENLIFDFSKSSEGDVFNNLGDNNIVINAPKGLALTSGNGQDIDISIENFELSGDVEFKIKIDLANFNNRITFWRGVDQIVILEFIGEEIQFGEFSAEKNDTAWKNGTESNELIITFSGDLAKAFLNGRLLASSNIGFSSLDRVEITGISRTVNEKDYIYSISLKQL